MTILNQYRAVANCGITTILFQYSGISKYDIADTNLGENK